MSTNGVHSGESAEFPHSVKFYKDDASLGRTVAEFLAPGLLKHEPAIVIATPEHRATIARELAARGVDVDARQREGDLQSLDADEVLACFMVGNEPDPVKFHETVGALIARACKDRLPCPLRAYGEMVDLLWKRANADGAIQLEVLWNHVATQAMFSLLCGYAVGNFYKEFETGPNFQTVCDHHNQILQSDN